MSPIKLSLIQCYFPQSAFIVEHNKMNLLYFKELLNFN